MFSSNLKQMYTFLTLVVKQNMNMDLFKIRTAIRLWVSSGCSGQTDQLADGFRSIPPINHCRSQLLQKSTIAEINHCRNQPLQKSYHDAELIADAEVIHIMYMYYVYEKPGIEQPLQHSQLHIAECSPESADQ